ncbi:MAG: hypothetical protein ACI31M_03375 [Bacilli bacterium]
MKENINALDEINKGATMGIDAIHFILDKVDDKSFEKVLQNQYEKYQTISKKVNEIYSKYNSKDTPHETNAINKAMTWYGIEMKTLTDHSNSKIAELLIKGTNMGIIEGKKILNNKEIDSDVKNIVEEYITMQEESLEELKNYL